jgi:hypothetical protein
MSYHFEEEQKEYLNGLYRFLINVGQKSLFDGLTKEDKQKELIYIHNKLILENPIAPKNIPPDIIYREFFQAVYYGSKEYKIFNIYQLVRSFMNWLRDGYTIPELHKLAGKELPSLKPAHLQLTS